jgi:protein-S-isoprenylcysteine O-methyltransferase Ste14
VPPEELSLAALPSRVQRAIRRGVASAIWLGALFGGAGHLDWPRGWIYAAAYLLMNAVTAVVVDRANPGLFEARTEGPRFYTKRFDKLFMAVFPPLRYIQPLAAGLDAVRLSHQPISVYAVYPGLLLFFLGAALVAWAMAVNRFAESIIRIQKDRGHTVVSSGPYRFVRHPMYVGLCTIFVAAPLILGSTWALAVSAVIVSLYLARTAIEDGTLRRELPGYEAYASHVRYRLLPGVW